MIVCHCANRSARELDAAIRAGATTVDDVATACGAAASCRGCIATVERLLATSELELAS